VGPSCAQWQRIAASGWSYLFEEVAVCALQDHDFQTLKVAVCALQGHSNLKTMTAQNFPMLALLSAIYFVPVELLFILCMSRQCHMHLFILQEW